ncbi:hypothetical protein D1007_16648 [Hordeum vulgare]|nr:hypothetical protein D1007_16648 [Hordeum vulgare]
MTGSDGRDDAFKKEKSFAAVGAYVDRTDFHPGQYSPSPNATPEQPCRPHDHGHRAPPSHGLCPRAPRYHHQGRRPDIRDLDATSPITHRYPNQRDEWKGPAVSTPELP